MKPEFEAKIKKTAENVLVFIFWMTVWQAAALIVRREILLPSPVRVLSRFFELAFTKDFRITSVMSLFRILSGFFIGIIFGTVFAGIASKVKIIKKLLSPVLTTAKSTPVASFIIIALVWLGKQSVPVFISCLIVLPVIWENVGEGVKHIDKNLVEVAEVFKFSRGKKFRFLTVPSVLPYFLSGCRASIGLAWKAGVAAEVLCTPAHSVGKMLFESKLYLETADLFAWTFAVIIMSVLLEIAIVRIISLVGKRHNSEGGVVRNAGNY